MLKPKRNSNRSKRRRYRKVKEKITRILRERNVPEHDIDLFFSDTAAGEFLRVRVGHWFVENGVSKEDVEEMFKYL